MCAHFWKWVDAGGVSPAARRLGVSESIVSRRLARVEQALGVQLLSRTTHGAVLTEAGATFREHAARIAVELDSAQEAISPAGDLRGLLRIVPTGLRAEVRRRPCFRRMASRSTRQTLNDDWNVTRRLSHACANSKSSTWPTREVLQHW